VIIKGISATLLQAVPLLLNDNFAIPLGSAIAMMLTRLFV
jgi:dolichol kinase